MPVVVPDKVNMNYANMIEEKNLKKGFIIATLVSTLVGTFASSHNLYERLKQTKKDANQDDKIKKLEEKFETEMKKKDGGGNDKSDELKNTLNSSGPLIRREYDVGFDRLGRRFAAGDILTENELQRQIILLQQTVIGVLEDALYSGRQINRAGIERLVFASESARNGSLDALKGQYHRLLSDLPPARPLLQHQHHHHYANEPEIIEVSSSSSASTSGGHYPPSPRYAPARPALLAAPLPPPPPQSQPSKRPSASGLDLFCRYSADLQLSPMPLARAFDPGRGSRCPGCRARLPLDADDMWEMEFPVRKKLPSLLLLPPPPPPAPEDRAAGATRRDPSPPGRSPSRHRADESRRSPRGRSRAGKEVVAAVVAEEEERLRQRGTGVVRMMRFRVPARFVAKCHTPEGDYACVLCCGPRGDYAGPVVLCDGPEALVDHVAREHRVVDIEREVDILPG